jgi:heme exporter protein C
MIWKFLLGIYMMLVIIGAFLYTPTAEGLGESTRILYFHVPCAWVATLAFLVSAVYSIIYLKKQEVIYDMWASSSAEIGMVFTILATITGSIWAKSIWHSYWNWDPRETSIFILLLIYAAYFALRSAVDDNEQKARLSAVYSIIAFVTVPFLIFIVPRILESLHPDPLINTERKINMNSKMLTVFLGSLTGFTLLYYWMLKLKLGSYQLAEVIQKRRRKD